MENVITDTGFVVGLVNVNDPQHQIIKEVYLSHSSILLPQTTLAEVTYLIGRESGIKAVVRFLNGLPKSHFLVVPLTPEDIIKTAEILEQYSDSRIDFVDATIMAISERLNISTILTLDQRDFNIYRPQHCSRFNILP